MRHLQTPLLIGLLILLSGCITDKKMPEQKSQEKPTPLHKKIPAAFEVTALTNKATFTLSAPAWELLQTNGFVVVAPKGKGWQEFEDLYFNNKINELPSLVTADTLLHLYHLVFDQLLQQLEKTVLLPALQKLSTQLLMKTLAEYKQLASGLLKDAALRAAAFCAVPVRILGKTPTLPPEIEALVHQEILLIEDKASMKNSPIFNYKITPKPREYKEDYTQYIPRGHYTRSEELKRYFKAMMWFGRMTFRFEHDEQILTTLILCRALQKKELKKLWNTIYQPTALLVGPSDNATIPDLTQSAQATFGKKLALTTLADQQKLAAFKKQLEHLPQPKINSLVALDTEVAQGISGACLMGQRFVVDASIFQQLIHPAIQKRFLPQALDIPAALGSNESTTILTESGEGKKYPAYFEELAKQAEKVAELTPDEWKTTTAGGWVYTLTPLLSQVPEEAPLFMQNSAWMRKQLQCFMGSWTELKHDTILYAKQAYSGVTLSPPEPEKQKPDTRGFVEPQPELYARLAELSTTTKEQLAKFNLLPENVSKALDDVTALVTTFKTIAEKELSGEERSTKEYDEIEQIGSSLSFIVRQFSAAQKIPLSPDDLNDFMPSRGFTKTEIEPAALVADVATGPEIGAVLEVAIGTVSELYAIVSIDGKPRITKGGCYSFYEFTQPMSNRLTDEAWRELLKAGKQPPQPAWVETFTVAA